uniref:Uncharacterized protein n=1 Tax=Anguilla anguilla TaxID=7936 RepID=A0A0E9S4C0_ANGAN
MPSVCWELMGSRLNVLSVLSNVLVSESTNGLVINIF